MINAKLLAHIAQAQLNPEPDARAWQIVAEGLAREFGLAYELVKDAPHGGDCVYFSSDPWGQKGCNCWRAKVLKIILLESE